MKSNSLKISLIAAIFINSCNQNSSTLILNNEQGKSTEVTIYEDGFLFKEFKNHIPNGRFIYCNNKNQIKKIEWYSNCSKPYYSFEIDSSTLPYNFVENYTFFKDSILSTPKIIFAKQEDGGGIIAMNFITPIDKTSITLYGVTQSSHRVNLFENSVFYYFENLNSLENIYMKFEFEGENGRLLKTIDSVKVSIN